MTANDKVLEVLKKSGKAMKGAEIAAAAAIDKKDVDKALKELKKQGAIESPKNCYYAAKK